MLLRRRGGGPLMVLDAKWKRLTGNLRDKKYGISQSDLYQMLAYGQTYLGGQGRLALLYPRWSGFDDALDPFYLPRGLRLDVLPFDLDRDELIGGPLQFDAESIHMGASTV